jgi:hypothetical protein
MLIFRSCSLCFEAVLSVCRQARQQFQELAPIWQRIFEMIAGESVEKYRAHWKFVTEQLVFLAAFAHWLETHQLITLAEVVQLIGGSLRT